MAAPLPAAEADHGSAVPPQCRPPPAGGLCLQPGGFVPAALPSHLHQTLYCDPGPAGPHRRSGVAAVGSSGWGDALLCDGEEDEPTGWGFGGREVTVPAAAGEPLPGLSAAAGSAGFGGRLGVPLASADPEVQDFSLGAVQLPDGLDFGSAGIHTFAALETFADLQTAGVPPNAAWCLPLPEVDVVDAEFMAPSCCL